MLSGVFKTYESLEDATTGQPLFSAAAWKSAKNLLTNVQMGFLSDPPGIPLYYQIGVDRTEGGLPVWCCCRGTNFTEGDVHHSIRDCFPPSSISARHAVNHLNFFMLCHNLLVGTPNRTGQQYNGHFEIWEYDHLQNIIEKTCDLIPDSQMIEGWVNTSMNVPTKEVYGILPIPEEVCHKSAMQPFVSEGGEKISHRYLASKQQTRYAVMNVHTTEEKQTFTTLMKTHPVFNRNNQDPDWKEAVKVWNSIHANGKTIFYKARLLFLKSIYILIMIFK